MDAGDGNTVRAISGSADGRVLVAAGINWIWRSVDHGATWTQVQGTDLGQWITVRCNDAATICLAGTEYDLDDAPGAFYRSTDSGASWSLVANSNGTGYWRDVWCNPSGTTWMAAMSRPFIGDFGWLYTSATSGTSFTQISGTDTARWGSVACDATATKCVATAGPDKNNEASPSLIYLSDNGFQTLTPSSAIPRGSSFGCTMSLDGTKILVAQYEIDEDDDGGFDNPGFVWRSGDGGQTFEETNAPPSYYFGVACDAAFKMCALGRSGDAGYDPTPMLTSCTGGHTWGEDPGERAYYMGVKVNADGGFMYAAVESTEEDDYCCGKVWSYPLSIV